MSLTGNLEDLGLGDILQIISLSRKSGTLRISALRGEARIVFREGQVRGALAPGSPVDFCALLTTAGAVTKDDFKYAEEESAASGRRVAEVLLSKNLISEERLEVLRRDVVENAVIDIFEWRSGEFCFDIGETGDPAEEMFAASGINAQYLAMEASRRRDESSFSTPESVDDPMGFAELGQEIRSEEMSAGKAAPSVHEPEPQSRPQDALLAEEDSFDAASMDDVEPLLSDEMASTWSATGVLGEAFEPLPSALQHEMDEAGRAEAIDPNEDTARSHFEGIHFGSLMQPATDAMPSAPAARQTQESVDEVVPPSSASASPVLKVEDAPRAVAAAVSVPPSSRSAAAASVAQAAPASSERDVAEPPPVIVVDLHLPVLEWIKKALSGSFEHVHIFQRTNLAVGRVRQYLARGQVPIFIISRDAPPDTLTGAKNSEDLVQRLHKQSPRMLILTLGEGGETQPIAGTQGLIEIPSVQQLLDVRRASENEALQSVLHQSVSYHLRRVSTQSRVRRAPAAAGQGMQQQALQRLREASACLREASQRGDVLESMLRFVSERFSRVALFLVRDGMAVGVSQIGLERAEGPTSAEMAQVSIPVREPAWFKAVLDTRAPVCCAPSNDGDRTLASLLGRIVPDEAYVAPLESGDQVIALLYADNLPERAPIGDTSALEVLLHQAGLALDRSFFERLHHAQND